MRISIASRFAIGMLIMLTSNISTAGTLSETLPYVVLVGGNAADWLSSLHFSAEAEQRRLLTGVRGCSEGNLRYRAPEGSMNAGKALREKMLLVGAMATIVYFTSKHDRKLVRWVGKGAAYVGGGMAAGVAIRNVHRCGW